MDLQLTQKTFIVSGGTKGIGAGISMALTQEGASVVIATRSNDDQSLRFVDDLLSKGAAVDLVVGDLATPGQCEKVVGLAVGRHGRIDGIVNNAGINDGIGLEAGVHAFMRSVSINLVHYYELVHHALPHLKKSRGAVVNISSKVALTGQGQTSGYAAAKGAQLALTREWAADLAPFGIRVNAVVPAEVMTPLYRRWLDQHFDDPNAKEAEIVKRIPLEQRMTHKEEIAAAVVFLLSVRSSHTTGQWIVIDGGYVHLDRALSK